MPMMTVLPSTLATLQAPAPPVGLVELTTLPPLSTATQSDVDGHEMPLIPLLPSTLVTVQAPAPPVGLVEVTTLPTLSTATQSDVDGHETPRSSGAVMPVSTLTRV